MRDLPRAVRNIHSLLLDGGQALLIFLASNPVFRMYRNLAVNLKWAQYMKVGGGVGEGEGETGQIFIFHIQDVESFIPVYQDTTEPGKEFQSLPTKTGFSVRKCEAVEFSFTFINQNQLIQALRTLLCINIP